MVRNELLRAMLRSLADVNEQGDVFEMSESWDVTVHAGRQGLGFQVPHVTRVAMKAEFVVVETHKGQRYTIVDQDVYAIGQEPSSQERKGRKAGFG